MMPYAKTSIILWSILYYSMTAMADRSPVKFGDISEEEKKWNSVNLEIGLVGKN